MNPRRDPRGRSSAFASVVFVSVATLAALAGCSSRPQDIVAPAQSSAQYVADSEPSQVTAPPSIIDRWTAPRIRIWTDGWRQIQHEGGVSLDPAGFYDLEIPAQQPVTFGWSAPSRGAHGFVAYRWSLDNHDIFDETPRIDSSDLAHWSAWSLTETSATVGPFDAAPHYFYVMARDQVGFVSMVTVRVSAIAASANGTEDLPVARR